MKIDQLFFSPDYYCFPSDLKDRVGSSLPVYDPLGRPLLAEACKDVKFIFILFSNRTGSNLVTDCLEQLGIGVGATNEPFLSKTIIATSISNGFLSVEEYFASTITEWKKNDFFFAKIGWDALFWLSSTGLFSSLLHRSAFILTERRDKIAQAISLLKAIKSDKYFEFRATSGTSDALAACQKPLSHNEDFPSLVDQILKIVHNLYVSEYRLRYFIDLHQIDVLKLVYDEFHINPQTIREPILEFLDRKFGRSPILSNPAPFNPRLVKQGNFYDDALATEVREFLLNQVILRRD